jgi:initiation factor 1A
MPKNLKGGKKFKQLKKKTSLPKRQFPIIENMDNSDELYYAQICNMLGNGRFIVKLIHENNLQEYIAKVRGSMYKKEWLKKNDFVLCSMRPTNEKTKMDIIFKYSQDEVLYLNNFTLFTSLLQRIDSTTSQQNNLNTPNFDNDNDNENQTESIDIDIDNI